MVSLDHLGITQFCCLLQDLCLASYGHMAHPWNQENTIAGNLFSNSLMSQKTFKVGFVAHAHNLKLKQEDAQEFKVSLGYIVNSQTA